MDNKKIILVIPYRGIGDLIFHLPLLRGLYQKYKSKINIITNSANKAKFLLNKEKSVKKIEYINFQRESQIKNSYLFLKKLNKYRADICVLTAPSKRLTIPLMMSNVKNKIFFKKDEIKDLSRYIINQSINKFRDINFIKKYNIILSKKKIKEKNVFLSIDSHHDQNNWREDNFIKLIEKLLLSKKIRKIYINFAPNKIKNFDKIFKRFSRNKKVFFTYQYNFQDIIKTINNCLYIIGNESGPACLGASIGKNVFSIYDPKHTPNLSSKIINKKIIYLNSKKLDTKMIIKKIIKNIN